MKQSNRKNGLGKMLRNQAKLLMHSKGIKIPEFPFNAITAQGRDQASAL